MTDRFDGMSRHALRVRVRVVALGVLASSGLGDGSSPYVNNMS